jgi:hypothetical protein
MEASPPERLQTCAGAAAMDEGGDLDHGCINKWKSLKPAGEQLDRACPTKTKWVSTNGV